MPRSPSISQRLVFLLVGGVLLASGSTASFGQGFFRQSARSGRFIEAPRRVQQQLREAQRALSENEDSDAVVRLGDLLQRDPQSFGDSDLSGQDFFIDIAAAETSGRLVRESLLRRARQMIGQLSSDSIETYQLRYGPMARKSLTDAQRVRDWEAVRGVRRKFFHTEAGYEASWLLAQRALLQGHALEASLLLDDVVSTPGAVRYLGRGVVQMHASACKVAGRDDIDDGVESDEVVANYASSPQFVPYQSGDYLMSGGGPDRNGNASGQMPLTNVRWDLPTTASPRQERDLETVAEELAASGKLPPPSWSPIRVGNQLLMRTTERLVGVDYRSGKRVWTWPWFAPAFNEEQVPFDSLPGEEGPGGLLSQRVWNDLPYGQLSSDGQRVFMLDDLGEVEAATFNPIGLGGTRPAETRTNTLVALELETEGKLLWRLGAGADEASELSEAFFLGPPLPLDGRLYVMVELAGDINLSCLDPATGEELWRQQLVAVESGSVEVDPIRRVAGATPTYYEGLLICSTGAGAVVAFDLADRVLRWGLTFDRNTEMARSITGRSGLEPTQLMQRWHNGAAIAFGDTVLVTPIESDRLFGLNLLTGERRFTEKNRARMRYLAGARDDKFLVVGATQVRAFDLHTGAAIWTSPPDMLAAGQQIIGRGVFGDGDYLIPTTANQLLRISLANGEVLQRRSTRYPLGNLIAVDGNVIVQGATSIAVAYGEASLEPLISKRLEADPNDFEALVRKSELLIQRGERRLALELLARAREMDPANDEVHLLSVAAMLGELRSSLDADQILVDTLDKLIDRPVERAEFLALRTRSSLSRQEYREASSQLLTLSSLLARKPMVAAAADQVVGDVERHCSLDDWLAARVHDVSESADESQLADVNELVRETVEPKLIGSDSLLFRYLRHFGVLDGIADARTELAKRYSEAGEKLWLERLLLGQAVPDEEGLRSLSDQRLRMLAEHYVKCNLHEDAVAIIDILRERGVSDFGAELQPYVDLISTSKGTFEWPRHVKLNWESQGVRSRGFAFPTQRVATTQVTAGRSFQHWRLVSEGTNPLALRDETGQLRPILLNNVSRRNDGDKEAQICGSFVLVVMPNELVGVDLYHVLSGDGESMAWRRGLTGDGSPLAKRRSETTPFEDQIVRYYISDAMPTSVLPEFSVGPILGDRVILSQGGDLMAIGLRTPVTMWRNSAAPKSGAVVAHRDRVAVVSPATKEVVYFDVRDGRKLEEKPWDYGEVWASVGSNVLCYRETETERLYEVNLINPFSGEVLQSTRSLSANRTNSDVPCGYGRVLSGRWLVMLDSDGHTAIWDLVEAREIGSPALPAYADLQGLHAVVLDGQIVLLPKRRVKPSTRLTQAAQTQTTDGRSHATTHGAFAVDLADGSLRWKAEFEDAWGCTTHQPAETPILVFTRGHSYFNSPTSARKKQLDAMAIDIRDGSVVNKTLGKTVLSTTNSIETRLTIKDGLSQVFAQIGNERLTYTFSRVPPADEVERSVEKEQVDEKEAAEADESGDDSPADATP